ncbi:MAG: translation initiation factor IF-3 [Bacteroidales bacterium]|nr:translation initiation factor IF-3 [Candidatus Scybalousia scybalohippi]
MKEFLINDEIQNSSIRLKDLNEIISLEDAKQMANNTNTDLIELSVYESNGQKISVCILQDYQKFIYLQHRKEKELKKNQVKNITKEIRFGLQIDNHDYEFKMKQARKFIQSKMKVKASVLFKGREIVFKDKGMEILLRLATDLEDIAKLEYMPKIEGKTMFVTLVTK